MKAVMYGAGNIGRGFVGALMSQAGYQVTFVDVDRELVGRLNAAGAYTLRVIESEGHRDTLVTGISAVNGQDGEAVARAVAECDLMATAVGARILPFIAPNIALGLKMRFAQGRPEMNIIICENLMDADRVLEKLIKKELTGEEGEQFDQSVGLVEASIGRMVPIQTEEMRKGDPLRVCVEGYGFLPVDRDAFKGSIPEMSGLVPYSPFEYYLRRKLWLHNMGHACCAYLGMYAGKTYIYEAVAETDILLLTRAAMLESVAALAETYQVPVRDLISHMDDLLYRFTNRALGDTCARVGGDIRRKMAPEDRLIGAARLCVKAGIPPVHIALGAAAAVRQFLIEEGTAQDSAAAMDALKALCGLGPDDALTGLILKFYDLIRKGAPLSEIRLFAREEKHRLVGPVV